MQGNRFGVKPFVGAMARRGVAGRGVRRANAGAAGINRRQFFAPERCSRPAAGGRGGETFAIAPTDGEIRVQFKVCFYKIIIFVSGKGDHVRPVGFRKKWRRSWLHSVAPASSTMRELGNKMVRLKALIVHANEGLAGLMFIENREISAALWGDFADGQTETASHSIAELNGWMGNTGPHPVVGHASL